MGAFFVLFARSDSRQRCAVMVCRTPSNTYLRGRWCIATAYDGSDIKRKRKAKRKEAKEKIKEKEKQKIISREKVFHTKKRSFSFDRKGCFRCLLQSKIYSLGALLRA